MKIHYLLFAFCFLRVILKRKISYPSDLNVVSWLWDFGDPAGTTSSLENPTHLYFDDGTYTVTLTIIDDRGCCTTVTDQVTCGDEPCTYGVCWEEMIAYQIKGINIEDPSGALHELKFEPPLTYGNCGCVNFYDHIVNEMMYALDYELTTDPAFAGLSYGTFSNDHPDVICNKGGNPYQTEDPSFFFTNSDFPFVQFIVALSNGTELPDRGKFYTIGACN